MSILHEIKYLLENTQMSMFDLPVNEPQPIKPVSKPIIFNTNSEKTNLVSGTVHTSKRQLKWLAKRQRTILGLNGNELFAYEWIWTWGVKYSAREDGMVDAKVSDWENADSCDLCGRKIVHLYYVSVKDKNGNETDIKVYGGDHAHIALGFPKEFTESELKKMRSQIINKEKYSDSDIEKSDEKIEDYYKELSNGLQYTLSRFNLKMPDSVTDARHVFKRLFPKQKKYDKNMGIISNYDGSMFLQVPFQLASDYIGALKWKFGENFKLLNNTDIVKYEKLENENEIKVNLTDKELWDKFISVIKEYYGEGWHSRQTPNSPYLANRFLGDIFLDRRDIEKNNLNGMIVSPSLKSMYQFPEKYVNRYLNLLNKNNFRNRNDWRKLTDEEIKFFKKGKNIIKHTFKSVFDELSGEAEKIRQEIRKQKSSMYGRFYR